MSQPIAFDVKSDDTAAAALPTVEYALVKQSSGYLAHMGLGADALTRCEQYIEYNGDRVIVTREVGTVQWFVSGDVTDVPDTIEGLDAA